jgi:hypothetical protein
MNTYSYAHAPDIYHGNNKLVGLNVNVYTYIDVEPGLTVFSAREKLTGGPLASVELQASAGQQYYFRYMFNFGLIVDELVDFKLIPQPIAREEIRKARYLPSPQ